MKRYLALLLITAVVYLLNAENVKPQSFSDYAPKEYIENCDNCGKDFNITERAGIRPLTEEDMEFIKNIPPLVPNSESKRNLPVSVDNSELKYFRPIWKQCSSCCAQGSGVAYNFTFEMNYLKDTDANLPENQHPSHYTYNFVNNGELQGTWMYDGWNIIKDNGCPTVADFGYNCGNYLKWMSGYDKYYNGMKYRVEDHYTIDVSNAEGIETLKQWIFDHANGESVGGIANFVASSQNFGYLPSASSHAGEK